MKKYFYLNNALIGALMLLFVLSCKQSTELNSGDIFLNHIAYLETASKTAVIKEYEGNFEIIDNTGQTILSGSSSEPKSWGFSNESYAIVNFTDLVEPGEYRLKLNNGETSETFKISATTEYEQLLKAAVKSYYLIRASQKLTEEYAGDWARPLGHPDTLVIVHESATGSTLKPGSAISSPGGWYDAGDYNKYIVNSAITVYTMLTAFDMYPDLFDSLKTTIPESYNSIPDVLDEIIYNIRWMLTMQDSDGGVYHKLTTTTFEDFIMPHEAFKPRYVVMKTTPASLDFASAMAVCSRVFLKVEGLGALADSCGKAAKQAWRWAKENPEVFYVQPEGMNTGEYNDTSLIDEWMWASVEMAAAFGNDNYVDEGKILKFDYRYTTPSWDVVNTLGLMTAMLCPENFSGAFIHKAKKHFFDVVDKLYDLYQLSPTATSLNYFKWGSNSDVANQSMLAWVAYRLTTDEKYAELATENLHYIFGENPTGYCYVTGFGTKTPKFIHHRISAADGVDGPCPGFLIGGPNAVVLGDCEKEGIVRPELPALSYTDSECSYSTNETAINWTAPLIFSVAGLIDYASTK